MDVGYEWNVMVLCLEGGGVKGYSSLLMLEKLMAKIAVLEQADSPPEGININPKHWSPHYSSFDSNQPGAPRHPQSVRESPLTQENDQDLQPIRSKSPPDPINLRKEMTKRQGKYLPCHYFDYIGGTSTGGLTAIMLGRLRLEVDECIIRYQAMSQNIFGHWRLSLWGLLRPKYSSKPFVKEIQDIVESTLPVNDEDPRCRKLAAPDDLCKTVVFAAVEDKPISYLFRTYRNEESPGFTPKNGGPPEDCQIWEAARATSAAPRYLKPMPIEHRRPVNGAMSNQTPVYIDGALRCNDPTPALIEEIRTHRRWRPERPGKSLGVKLVLTLGTGQKPTTKVKAGGLAATHFKRIAKSLETHLLKPGWAEMHMPRYAEQHEFAYFKWDGGLQVEAISLDDCRPKTFKNMEEWTKEYMGRSKIKGNPGTESDGELWKVATQLVEERRNRIIRSEKEWKRFATCDTYRCPLKTCRNRPNIFNTMQGVEHHIEAHHPNWPEFEKHIEVVPPCLRGPWCHDTPLSMDS